MNYYSDSWFESASKEELQTEREKVRLEKMAIFSTYSDEQERWDADEKLRELLDKFDDALINIYDREHTDSGFTRHREHGWYLPNDD